MEYEVVYEEEGAWNLQVNGFGIAKIYFEAERCSSPLSSEEAKEILETVKCLVESKHPASELKEEDYEPSDFGKFLKALGEYMELMED